MVKQVTPHSRPSPFASLPNLSTFYLRVCSTTIKYTIRLQEVPANELVHQPTYITKAYINRQWIIFMENGLSRKNFINRIMVRHLHSHIEWFVYTAVYSTWIVGYWLIWRMRVCSPTRNNLPFAAAVRSTTCSIQNGSPENVFSHFKMRTDGFSTSAMKKNHCWPCCARKTCMKSKKIWKICAFLQWSLVYRRHERTRTETWKIFYLLCGIGFQSIVENSVEEICSAWVLYSMCHVRRKQSTMIKPQGKMIKGATCIPYLCSILRIVVKIHEIVRFRYCYEHMDEQAHHIYVSRA